MDTEHIRKNSAGQILINLPFALAKEIMIMLEDAGDLPDRVLEMKHAHGPLWFTFFRKIVVRGEPQDPEGDDYMEQWTRSGMWFFVNSQDSTEDIMAIHNLDVKNRILSWLEKEQSDLVQTLSQLRRSWQTERNVMMALKTRNKPLVEPKGPTNLTKDRGPQWPPFEKLIVPL